jgi:hypothetical protein
LIDDQPIPSDYSFLENGVFDNPLKPTISSRTLDKRFFFGNANTYLIAPWAPPDFDVRGDFEKGVISHFSNHPK